MFKQTFQRRCVICGNPTSRNDAKYCCRACVAEAQRRAVYRHCCKLCGTGYKSGSPTPTGLQRKSGSLLTETA